jgi:hypothetical protein
MASETYPLSMPEDLLETVRRVAQATGLSMADTMRQSMKLGLPKLEVELSSEPPLRPLTPDEIHRCYEVPNKEFDALEHHMASVATCPQPKDLDE